MQLLYPKAGSEMSGDGTDQQRNVFPGATEGEGTSHPTGNTEMEQLLAAMARDRELHASYFQWQREQSHGTRAATSMLERFKKLYPVEFEGSTDPAVAEDWMKGATDRKSVV